MPLNYSEKDTKVSASIVQTLGALCFFFFNEITRKSHVLHTQSVCVHEEKLGGLNSGWQDKFLRHCSLLTVALETCLHTVAQL